MRAAEQGDQPRIAISGLNAMRQTLDRLMHLAGHDRPPAEGESAIASTISFDLTNLAERLIQKFDHEPDLKARIAAAIFALDDDGAKAEPNPDQPKKKTDHEPA